MLESLDTARLLIEYPQSTLKLDLLGLQLRAEHILHLFAQREQVLDRHRFPFALHDVPRDHESYRLKIVSGEIVRAIPSHNLGHDLELGCSILTTPGAGRRARKPTRPLI